jgi:hypothetical protein
MLDDDPMGESPIGGDCPVTTVAIPDDDEGDRVVASSGVRVSVGWATSQIRQGGAQVSRLQRVANFVSPEIGSPPEADGGGVENVERFPQARRPQSPTKNWVRAVGGISGVSEGDMLTRIDHRKHGTSRGSPRPRGTAKAPPISRSTAKWWRACEWDGWGRLSEDGPGHYNPDRSEGPWGRATRSLERRRITETTAPTLIGIRVLFHGVREGLWQTLRRSCRGGRPFLICQPWSRTGECSDAR